MSIFVIIIRVTRYMYYPIGQFSHHAAPSVILQTEFTNISRSNHTHLAPFTVKHEPNPCDVIAWRFNGPCSCRTASRAQAGSRSWASGLASWSPPADRGWSRRSRRRRHHVASRTALPVQHRWKQHKAVIRQACLVLLVFLEQEIDDCTVDKADMWFVRQAEAGSRMITGNQESKLGQGPCISGSLFRLFHMYLSFLKLQFTSYGIIISLQVIMLLRSRDLIQLTGAKLKHCWVWMLWPCSQRE